MLKKIKNVYKQEGARKLFRHSIVKVFRSSGNFLLNTADRFSRIKPSQFFLSQYERKLLGRNRTLKNKHKGRRCFILGTGPSIKTQDLLPLAHEITLAMAAFWKHLSVEKWQPTYYCIADPLFFDGSESVREFFGPLNQRIHHSTFFVPLVGARVIQEQQLLPLERTHYVAFPPGLSYGLITDIDFVKRVPFILSVSQLCIMAAIYMGCSPIYLLGLDHDWLTHTGHDRHFYESLAGLEKHPEVRTLADWGYKTVMESTVKLWHIYEMLSAYAHRRGIRILNATNGGFLDVFERISYERVVEEQVRS